VKIFPSSLNLDLLMLMLMLFLLLFPFFVVSMFPIMICDEEYREGGGA
jgi:hypothetical protein